MTICFSHSVRRQTSYDNPGLCVVAVTMKNVMDATLLRNRMVALLEEARPLEKR